jgi:hypothetical protein
MPTAHEPTVADFDQTRCQEIIDACEKRDCSRYWSRFFDEARQANSEGQSARATVFALLGDVCSFAMQLDRADDPFVPMIAYTDSRTSALDDLSDSQLSFISKIFPHVTDSELQGRLADVVWCRKRGFEAAQTAIDAYVESCTAFEQANEKCTALHRLERALQLGRFLGKESEQFRKAAQQAEEILQRWTVDSCGFLYPLLMELLVQHRVGDPAANASRAESAAVQAEKSQNWELARACWDLVADWNRITKSTDAVNVALLRLAETYVQEADEAYKSEAFHRFTLASRHLESAIEVLRKVPGTKVRRDELHKTLLEYQQKSYGEMFHIEHSIDLTKLTTCATEAVKGKTVREALMAIAFWGDSPDVASLRQNVEQAAREYPLQASISMVTVDRVGKVVARRPAVRAQDESDREAAIKAEMFRDATRNRQALASGFLYPALAQVNREHRVRLSDLSPFAFNNPFVPSGREMIFVKGLHAGITGDLLVAGHLLIPQLENSIRHILKQRQVITSTLDSYGIQNEQDLNTLLYRPELVEVFNEDTLFDLKGLLVEHCGSNLRNLMAHGLMGQGSFFTTEIVYLWWLTLRLCAIPLLRRSQANEGEEQTGDEPDA